jgi:hypothetical protein
MRQAANVDEFDSEILALLLGALDSVERTEDLIGQIRQTASFRSERREIRGAAELLGEARDLLRSVLLSERGR